jgi:hypothetical protein
MTAFWAGAVIHASTSSGVVGMTSVALAWIGATIASAVSPNHSPLLKIPLSYRLTRGVAHEFALSNLLLVLNYSPEA